MKWYGKKIHGIAEQGLICDETTGENIAVCYNGEHANLIATAPEMLEALKICADRLLYYFLRDNDENTKKAYRLGVDAINNAEESVK